MNRRIIDEAITRFIAGAMSRTEEQEFLRRVSADPELRRALDAERTIERTLRNDRDALPSPAPEVRGVLVGMLDRNPLPRRGFRSLPWSSRMVGATLMKGVAIAAIGGGVLAVVHYSAPSPAPDDTVAVRSVRQPARVVAPTAVPAIPAPSARQDADVRVEPMVPGGAAPAHAAATVAESKARNNADAHGGFVVARKGEVPQAQSSSSPERPADLPVVAEDTMHVNVTIDLERIGRAKEKP